jgi:soluble lytic murein transglycosylase-like protein
MKKVLLCGAVLFLSVLPTLAQTRARVFDNFDTERGVQLITPKVAPIVEYKSKPLVKKTSQNSPSLQNNLTAISNFKSTAYSKISMFAGKSMNGFTTGDSVIDSYIVDSCIRYGIDPLLVYAQMHQESSFKLKATSYKGARGLMQLMPATAIRFGVRDIYNPKQNIEAGVKYMRWLLNTFGGDVALALAGYNAGEGAVMKYGNQIPPYRETQEYVRRISARYSSISNPNIAKVVRKVSTVQAVKLEQKESAPLTNYEQSVTAIKLPDGRMRLVNQ